MKPTVLLKSSVVPCSCWCSDMPSGHIWVLRLVKVGQSCSIWSAVWSPVWHVQSGDCTSFIVLYICEFSRLCPVRRRRIMTCSARSSFVVVVRDLLSPEAVFDDRLFFCQRDGVIMLWAAPLFASLSAISFPLIPQWAGIHCNTTHLFSREPFKILIRYGSFWF